MTVPDPTAPTAEDVIARALVDGLCIRCIGRRRRLAAAVVAAIRAMTVEQLVDLRPDLTIEYFCRPGSCAGGPNCGKRRVVGEWRYPGRSS